MIDEWSRPSLPSPSPVIAFYFLLSSQLSRRTRAETLAIQAKMSGADLTFTQVSSYCTSLLCQFLAQ